MQRRPEAKTEAKTETETETETPFSIAADPSSSCRKDFWRSLRDFYKEETFCDLRFVSGSSSSACSFACHRLVLAALSGSLRGTLLAAAAAADGAAMEEEGATTVLLPDHEAREIKDFLDWMYSFLAGGEDAISLEEEGLLSTLGIDLASLALEAAVAVAEAKKEGEEANVTELKRSKRRRGAAKKSSYDDYEWSRTTKRRRTTRRKGKATARAPEGEGASTAASVDAGELASKIRSREGELEVKLKPEVFSQAAHCGLKRRKRSEFMALLSARRTAAGGGLEVFPLCWTMAGHPESRDDAELTRQHSELCRCLRSVFGLSSAHVHYHRALCNRMGGWKSCKANRVNYVLRRKLASYSDDQLREELERADIVEAFKEGHARKDVMEPPAEEVKVSLRLTENLSHEEAVGILFVSLQKDGRLEAYCVCVREDNKQEDAGEVIKAATYVWTLGQAGSDHLSPPVEGILAPFKEVMGAAETRTVCLEFLSDGDGSVRRRILDRQRVCEECGAVFRVATCSDEARFTLHRRTHFYRNFECACAEAAAGFASLREKKRHVQLVHIVKGFEKCERCGAVTTSEAMARHIQKVHR